MLVLVDWDIELLVELVLIEVEVLCEVLDEVELVDMDVDVL